jgi:hypothetical protein
MNTLNHSATGSISNLTDSLNAFIEAGIDPAFDAECEELERQYAELRMTFNHN